MQYPDISKYVKEIEEMKDEFSTAATHDALMTLDKDVTSRDEIMKQYENHGDAMAKAAYILDKAAGDLRRINKEFYDSL